MDTRQIPCSPDDLGRVLLNLLTNAAYAVREKHRLTPASANYHPTIWLRTQAGPEAVEISIRDNGAGLPPEVQQQIFQPFFTTKPLGEGTGLGLSISQDIIQRLHGGSLVVSTEPGHFTEFVIRLPWLA